MQIESALLTTISLFCYFMIIFSFNREIMANHFIDSHIRSDKQFTSALSRMRNLGARFDAKVISFSLLLPLITSGILSFFLSENTVTNIYLSFIGIIGFIIISITLGNYYYYKTYHNYYDVFIFGLVEEDTQAVLKNIYDDYPVFKFILLVLILSLLPIGIAYFIIAETSFSLPLWGKIIAIFCYALITFGFLRGTIHSKPLGKIHAQVSSLSVINKMVPNGVIAVRWAFKDRKQDVSFEKVSLEEGVILMQNALDVDTLVAHTPKNEFLEKNQPNVIFTVMESFGMNLFITDEEKSNNLLGALREHIRNEYFFTRFLSSTNGTIATLADLYFHSSTQEITQSSAQNIAISYTPFNVYKSKGYKTIFISSGNLMWRNLAGYLPLQGVDELYDQNDLIDRYPEAKKTLSYWGIADEYAFKLAEDLLLESTVPVFINILTITNHPPYDVPKNYKAAQVNPSILEGKFGANDSERRNTLETYQYSANALGHFMTNIKLSKKGDNTIVAATGDHHIRGMKQNMPKELFLAYAVPFILSVPNQLKTSNIQYDPQRLGSHKDIMPTLYKLSLSDATYWSAGGEDLLQPQSKNYFAYNHSVLADSEGVVDIMSPELTKYGWSDSNNLFTNEAQVENKQKSKIEAYFKLRNWQINYLVKGEK